MTRWDLLKDMILMQNIREAIGKAWPLFFLLIFRSQTSNKFISNYPELQEILKESSNTIKKWKAHLVENKVIEVINGRTSMTFSLLKPYDSLVTCEQDDITKVKMTSDPTTAKMLDKISSYGNISLLPIVAELSSKLDRLEKKLGD